MQQFKLDRKKPAVSGVEVITSAGRRLGEVAGRSSSVIELLAICINNNTTTRSCHVKHSINPPLFHQDWTVVAQENS